MILPEVVRSRSQLDGSFVPVSLTIVIVPPYCGEGCVVEVLVVLIVVAAVVVAAVVATVVVAAVETSAVVDAVVVAVDAVVVVLVQEDITKVVTNSKLTQTHKALLFKILLLIYFANNTDCSLYHKLGCENPTISLTVCQLVIHMDLHVSILYRFVRV